MSARSFKFKFKAGRAFKLRISASPGSVKAPAAERSPAGPTCRTTGQSQRPNKTPQSQCPTHLTRDGRPTGSTCPPWPRPMGAPGVAGVGGRGRMTTSGNRAAGARARLHQLRPARSRLHGSRLSGVRPRPPLRRRPLDARARPYFKVASGPRSRGAAGVCGALGSPPPGGSDPDRDRGPCPTLPVRRGLLQSGQVTVAPCSPLPSCPALRPMVPGIDPHLRRRNLTGVPAALRGSEFARHGHGPRPAPTRSHGREP